MPEPSGRTPAGAPPAGDRFDADSIRRILERAVEEQQRGGERPGSWSLEELEEAAAEAHISREALHAAIEAHRREAAPAAARRTPGVQNERPRDWLTRLEDRLPAHWPPSLKQTVLAVGGFIVLTGLLLALGSIAPTAFWVTSLSMIAVSLLVLMGASPF